MNNHLSLGLQDQAAPQVPVQGSRCIANLDDIQFVCERPHIIVIFLFVKYICTYSDHTHVYIYIYTLTYILLFFLFALKPPFKCHLFHQWDRSHQSLKFSAVSKSNLKVSTSMLQPLQFEVTWNSRGAILKWSKEMYWGKNEWKGLIHVAKDMYMLIKVTWDLRNHFFWGESIPSRGSIFSPKAVQTLKSSLRVKETWGYDIMYYQQQRFITVGNSSQL